MSISSLVVALAAFVLSPQPIAHAKTDINAMASIKGGTYRPLYLSEDSPMVTVGNFHIDKTPVTNQQFAKFVANNPKWQKQNIAKLFAEPDYLAHWQKTRQGYYPNPADVDKPVVNVS